MYTAYGTAVKDRQKLDRQRDDHVYDKHGLRRFHGAFEGGWTAGYFNTVGSEEGWTPRKWSSTKPVSNTVQDYIDDEDEPQTHAQPEKPEIAAVGHAMVAKWGAHNSGYEVIPERQKPYRGPGGIGYDSRLTDEPPLAVSASSAVSVTPSSSTRLLMSVDRMAEMKPGAGKKRPLVLLDDEDDGEEYYPVVRSLPKVRKSADNNTSGPKGLVKHRFISAKERQAKSSALATVSRDSAATSATPTAPYIHNPAKCSDGKLPLSGFVLSRIVNAVFVKFGLATETHNPQVAMPSLEQQVDSFLASIAPPAPKPVSSYLSSKFELAGARADEKKEEKPRTIVEDWTPEGLLCKRMGVRYMGERESQEDKVVEKRAHEGGVDVGKLRRLFQ